MHRVLLFDPQPQATLGRYAVRQEIGGLPEFLEELFAVSDAWPRRRSRAI